MRPASLRGRVVTSGERLPVLVRHVTQRLIDDYAQASKDFNPIHCDLDFAKAGPFGRTIAHGLMTLAFVSEMLNEWSGGSFDEVGELDVTFVAPVFSNETLEISGVVEDVNETQCSCSAKVRLICMAGERPILTGHAIQRMV